MTHTFAENYDVIVIGAGHAGVEAGLAASRMGCKTLLATINLDMVAFMPCNPSIGGSAKGLWYEKLMPWVAKWVATLTRPISR